MAQTKVDGLQINNQVGFSAYNSVPLGTAIPSATFTKVQFDLEYFDTHGYYDASTGSTGSRFLPLTAGLYQLSSQVGLLGVADQATVHLCIYKNGTQLHWNRMRQSGSGEVGISISATVQANGTTDYFEIMVFTSGVATNVGGSNVNAWFTGVKL